MTAEFVIYSGLNAEAGHAWARISSGLIDGLAEDENTRHLLVQMPGGTENAAKEVALKMWDERGGAYRVRRGVNGLIPAYKVDPPSSGA
jgi:hypothetical protein